MLDLDKLTPEEYRARYLALQEAARARAAAPPAIPQPAEVGEVLKRESIPPGWYIALRLKRGEAMRITNPGGTPGAALFFWNADDTSERFNAGDTTKLQWTTNLTTGRVLFSDMGRVLMSIIAPGMTALSAPIRPRRLGGGATGATICAWRPRNSG